MAAASGPLASTKWASGTIPSSRIPSRGSTLSTRARYERWFQSSGARATSDSRYGTTSAARRRPRCGDGKVFFCEIACQHAGVVPEPSDPARVAWDAVLLQANRSLRHRPREEDPWDGGTLPERRQRREAILVECRQSQRTEVTEGRGEAGCGDDCVGVEDKFARPGGARSEDLVAGAGALDAACGGVQRDDPAPQRMVLIRQQVPRPNTGRGPALNRQH